MQLNIKNEFDRLSSVIVGTAESCGGRPHLEETYDPKSREHLRKGVYPYDSDMMLEMEQFVGVLKKYDVEVLRPTSIEDLNQIFARDLGFVVDEILIIPEIIREREKEQQGISPCISKLTDNQIIRAQEGVRIEGGDVIVHENYLLVGYANEEDFYSYKTARTNEAGLDFLKTHFPDREVIGFELNKSDYEPRENALHLDCCFQPLGLGHALIFEDGFSNLKDVETLREIFDNKLLKVSRNEMYLMGCNVFSIDRDLVVSERGFIRINEKLQSLGYQVEEIPYYQISKLEGLLRCSTLPLHRHG
ncbi:MAG: amidinotransferase [Bacteroidia bacterium]